MHLNHFLFTRFFRLSTRSLYTFSLLDPTSLPILFDDVNCRGTEPSIAMCPRRTADGHNCGHGEDVVVSCSADPAIDFGMSAAM